MNHTFDPNYATAMSLAEHHFPIQPVTENFEVPKGIYPSADPILTHERFSGPYKGHLIQLPTGTTSGVLAIRVNKPNRFNPANGAFPFQRLVEFRALNSNTAFYQDRHQCMYLYECHNEVIIEGAVEIAEGITMFGNRASITMPPYRCPETNRLIAMGDGMALTRESLAPISVSMMEYVVDMQNVRETYRYHLRDAA